MSQTNEMVKLAITALEDKKGEDIRVIDIHEVSVLAITHGKFFILSSAFPAAIKIRYHKMPSTANKYHVTRSGSGTNTTRHNTTAAATPVRSDTFFT